MTPIEEALLFKKELDNLRPLTKEQEAIIMQKFRLEWNYNSNNLEGNSLTYGETKALLLHGITAQGKPLRDHIEITGHDEAIKWIEDLVKGDYPLTENFIRELHTLLLKDPYEVQAITPEGKPTSRRIAVGQYKTAPNHVLTKTGEIFRFATPEETPAEMHDLILWYRKEAEKESINAIILAAEFHYRFIRIHPFDDGNGRTARIVMNFILMKYGYPPVIIKTEDKNNYFSALQLADAGEIEPFIQYISKNLVRSLEIMIAGATGKSIEEENDIDKEIALLEQRIKANSNTLAIYRTKEDVRKLYSESVLPLWSSFLFACQKFDRFYLEAKAKLYIIGDDEEEMFKPTEINEGTPLRKINEHTEAIILQYNYKTFKTAELPSFDFHSQIRIQLNLAIGFIVSTGDKSINFRYGSQLSEHEIRDFIGTISKAHTNYIQAHLKSF